MGASLATRTLAANRVANENIARGGSDFYAEFGTNSSGNTPIWSIVAGAGGVTSSTAAGVFSVSKAFYAMHIAQVQTLTNTDRPYLNMTSGRDTANGATCPQDNTTTVDVCMTTTPGMGVGNGANLGKFNYDSLHQEWHADKIATVSWASKVRNDIAALYQTTFGQTAANLSMSSATVSGGVIARPTTLRNVAQQLMNGTLNLKSYLLDAYPAVNASTFFTDGSVVGSPAPATQPWKYKDNHWIEPNNGGYWWAGSGGTVLWMDPTFTNYGLLFRVADLSGGEMGTQSIYLMQQIRRAFYGGSAALSRKGTARWTAGKAFGPMRRRAF